MQGRPAGSQPLTVVLPAYNAALTLEETLRRLPSVAEILLVDDGSRDGTASLARKLGLQVQEHPHNRGYGANQKSCYRWALERGAQRVVMLHPDLQYPPEQVEELAELLEQHDLAFGSRFRKGDPRQGGMPAYKFWANRGLTAVQNRVLPAALSEYHSGFRAYTRATLEKLPWRENRDDFLFDNQLLLQAIWAGLSIGELGIPAHYGPESSSISAEKSVKYGIGVLGCTLDYVRARRGGRKPGWLNF